MKTRAGTVSATLHEADRLLLRLGEGQLLGDRVGERREVEPDDEAEEEREPRQVEDPVPALEGHEVPDAGGDVAAAGRGGGWGHAGIVDRRFSPPVPRP